MALTAAQLKSASRTGEYCTAPFILPDGTKDRINFKAPTTATLKDIQARNDDDLTQTERMDANLQVLVDHVLDEQGQQAFANVDEIPVTLIGQLLEVVTGGLVQFGSVGDVDDAGGENPLGVGDTPDSNSDKLGSGVKE